MPSPRRATPATPERPIREVDLDWRSVAVVLAAFTTLVALTGLVRSAPRSLTGLAVGTLLALALNPLVDGLARRVRCKRSVAVGLVLAGFGMAVALLLAVLAPPAVREAQDLQDDLPEVVAELGDLPLVGDRLEEADVPDKVQAWIDDLPERLTGDATPIIEFGRAAFDAVLAASITMLVAICLLLDGERLVARGRSLVPPHQMERAERLARKAYEVVGRYVAGSLLVALCAGVSVLAVGLLLGVPLAPLLAMWVMVFNLVPQIGGAVGGVPFVALGFTVSPTVGVACVVFFILYLQFENNLLSPLIVGQAVKLSPPATMVAALVGVSAAGVVGALVAVPVLGASKAIYQELRPPPDADAGTRDDDAEDAEADTGEAAAADEPREDRTEARPTAEPATKKPATKKPAAKKGAKKIAKTPAKAAAKRPT